MAITEVDVGLPPGQDLLPDLAIFAHSTAQHAVLVSHGQHTSLRHLTRAACFEQTSSGKCWWGGDAQASSTFGSLGIPGSKRPGLPLSQCCSQQAKQQSTARVGNSHITSRPLLHSPMGSVPARSAIRSRSEQDFAFQCARWAHHNAVIVTGPVVAELGPLQHCQRAVPMAGRVWTVASRV